MNPDLANLLGAIRDQPGDEIAYLALADWCLEQPRPETQARGEHVRLSRQLSKLMARLDRNDSEATALRQQVKALEKRYRSVWLGSMRSFSHRCDFRPGGLVDLEVSEGRLAQMRAQRVEPATREDFSWVSRLQARTLDPQSLDWLGAHLPEGFLRTFSAWASIQPGRPILDRLVRCPWIDGLRSLWLAQFREDADGIRLLSEHPSFARLEELFLPGCGVGFAALAVLADSPNLVRLRHLTLSGPTLAVSDQQQRIQARWADSLRSLSLEEAELDSDGVWAICHSGFASRLEGLSLEKNPLTEEAIALLASWPGLAHLQRLNLSNTGLTDSGLRTLTESPHLGELRELRMQNNRYVVENATSNRIGNNGLIALAESRGLSRLTVLDIGGNDRVDDRGLLALCRSESLPALKTLRHQGTVRQSDTRQALSARFRA